MRCFCLAALATVATFTPATLRAQFAIEGGGMYLSFSGDDFTNTKAGAGFEGQVRFAVAPRITLGIGAQHSTHKAEIGNIEFGILGVYVEPRLALPLPGAIKPYVAVRGLYSRYQFDESPGNSIHATGTAFSAGAGAMVALAPFISFDVGAHYYFRYSFGNAQDETGAEQANSDATGAGFQLRAALSIGLGGP